MLYVTDNGRTKLIRVTLNEIILITSEFGSAFWRAANEILKGFTPEGVDLLGHSCPSETQCENWDDLLFSAYVAGIKAVYTARKEDAQWGMPRMANNSQSFEDNVLTFSTQSGDWTIEVVPTYDGWSIEGPLDSSIWTKFHIENSMKGVIVKRK